MKSFLRTTVGVLLVGFLFDPLMTQAVSRIGGGTIGSLRTGFVAQSPEQFAIGRDEKEQLLVLQGPPAISKVGFEMQWILLKDFDLQYPEMAMMDKKELDSALMNLGHQSVETGIACVLAWQKDSVASRQVILSWGSGRGVVITATQTLQSRQGLSQILGSIRLNDGACGWN